MQNGMGENYSLENIVFFKKSNLDEINKLTNWNIQSAQHMETLSTKIGIHGEVKKLLIKLKNSKMFEKKDFILNTINTALNDVFPDQMVKIDLVASNTNQEASKLNIKYDIVLFQNGREISRNEKMVDQNGGGIISFISILFKILVGFIYSRNKFYVFDESLSEVSELYMPRMGQFLQKFCKVHGFTIIIITHTQAIADYSDLTYRLDGEFENGVPTLKIEKIDGEYPEEDYVYSKIENFQSIKKLEFRYKGFTTIIGKNNIGKSASFRAINSILFNNFDIKLYPRFESADKPDKLLNTRVEFGYFTKKDDPENEVKKISFYKKGQSIIWEFDGLDHVGKNLAFEKVKEKVESIGFRYLKLKEQYKNFKGNLKDQTERLAITTQQDGYYLIGGKASDTSKVFDFLFDSREVTLALIDLNNDIQTFENELNAINLDIGKNKNLISRLQIELKKWDVLFKIKLIEQYKYLVEVKGFMENEIHYHEKEYEIINNILDVADIMWRIDASQTHIDKLNIVKNKNLKIVSDIDRILDVVNHINLIKGIFELSNKIDFIKKAIKLNQIGLNIIKCKEILEISKLTGEIRNQFNIARRKFDIFSILIVNRSRTQVIENIFITHDNISIQKKYQAKLLAKFECLNKIIFNRQLAVTANNIKMDMSNTLDYIQKVQKAVAYNKVGIRMYEVDIEKAKLNFFISGINSEINKINLKRSQIDKMVITIENLPASYNLVPCNSCMTLGYTSHMH